MIERQTSERRAQRRRLRLDVRGVVQGVGFRPFVHRLATAMGLAGFVRNTGEGASLEVEGDAMAVAHFLDRLDAELSPPAAIHARRSAWLPTADESGFRIASSELAGLRSAIVAPDLAPCRECVDEIFDSRSRRYRYPFTSCTRCGPRYSIVAATPYDRAHTAMRGFPMCPCCEAEYRDPTSRRFHAEINACPACGPQLSLLGVRGERLATGAAALKAAVAAVSGGRILAIKGLGGFQLAVEARDQNAVARLRERKARPAKPFAIMAATLAEAVRLAHVNPQEERLLTSPAAPIVLLRARSDAGEIAPAVAPDNPWLGIMLPATPVHHLLLRELGFPIVATSGNRSGEPIVTEETEALEKLGSVADVFLTNDRPILRPLDDSVVRVIADQATVLRCARGYAPQVLPASGAPRLLALGAHQKVAIAVGVGDEIVLGQHIGDMSGAASRAAHAQAIDDMQSLYRLSPEKLTCDAHPAYHTTRVAERLAPEPLRVPHHLAHVLAGMLDHEIDGPILGVAWDGAGYGADGAIWGGEFLAVDDAHWRRAADLSPFRLPGGEASMREPRRAALGALHATFGDALFEMSDLAPVGAFDPAERSVLRTMLNQGLNAPWTTSAGRLFDVAASLLGLCQKMSFEGEAALALEFAADRAQVAHALPAIEIVTGASPLTLDWRGMLAAIAEARRSGASAEALAAGFHDALAAAITAVAQRVGLERVVLTGGCFQNRRLAELAIAALRVAGFRAYWHRRIPPNDGGIAAGQAAFAVRPRRQEKD